MSAYRSLDATDLRASILAGERTAADATQEALAAIAAARRWPWPAAQYLRPTASSNSQGY